MPLPNSIDICKKDLFTKKEELEKLYPQKIVDKVLRVREMYNWFIGNPEATDREFIAEEKNRHDITKVSAYNDLAIVKALLPMLSQTAREFHRWRFNEMILNTYKMAVKRKDTKTMEKAAASYAKYNRVDYEEDAQIPYEMIVVQPFTATNDPSVLGIKPIPNIQQKISQMLEKYRAESMDIEDIEFEEPDLEFDNLFPNQKNESDEENIL